MTASAVILFDGVCNLCNGMVRFVIRRDRAGYFRFAPLGSAKAQELLGRAGVTAELPDSMVLVDEGRVYTRSGAMLRVARRLGWPWRAGWVLMAVPRVVRDWMYDVVARRRHRWFGRRAECMVPTEEVRGRFLE